VITGTYSSHTFDLRQLWIDGLAEPIEATGRHPIYSEDRLSFVGVSDLRAGERLRTRSGTATVESVQPAPGRWRVFNLEIGRIHQYYVSDLEVLVHNDCTEIAQAFIDNGDPGVIYRLAPKGANYLPSPPAPPGPAWWKYHDVLVDEATNLVKDPMIFKHSNWIDLGEWLARWGYDSQYLTFGPKPL
jgi:Pretoxin HINT domain